MYGCSLRIFIWFVYFQIEGTTREQQLHGITACQTDDVLQKKWLSN